MFLLLVTIIIAFVKTLYSDSISLFMFFLLLSPILNDMFFENKKLDFYLIYPTYLQRIVFYKNLTIALISSILFILSDILIIFVQTYPSNLIASYSQFALSLVVYILVIQCAYLINKNNSLRFFQLLLPSLSAFIPLVFSYITFYFFNITVNILIFLMFLIAWYFWFIPYFSKSLYRGNLKCMR